MDKTDLMYEMMKEMKEDIRDLKEFKNRLIGGSIVAGAVFATFFEFIKSFFTRG